MKSLNRILTDVDRKDYQPVIDLMWKLVPDMMSRKIVEANVQQAFVFDTVINIYEQGDSILGVGIFEDTAYSSLVEYGYDIFGFDPETDGSDLHHFFLNSSIKYNIIFSTSVIEHVQDDEQFISEICQLLKPNGTAVITCDFLDSYKPGDSLHATALRFYTKQDLEVRFPAILEKYGCKLISEPLYVGEPDFVYQGHKYSLATFVFRKLDV